MMSRLLVLLGWMCLAAGPAHAGDESGNVIDFTLPKLGGGAVSLSDFRGQWVVINYWATWCAPCRKEIPELSKMHRERGDITVLGLAYEDTDDKAFAEFLAEFDVSYPILRVDVYDPPQPFGSPRALPTTILLDPQGRSAKTFMGPVTRQAIEQFIAAKAASPQVSQFN
jgi:thiol-disulfide isomerase/thioredoxin